MNTETKQSLLKTALAAFGVIFMLVYPVGLVWPSGWVWHAGQGNYYLQMICTIYAVLGVYLIIASRNPAQHRSLVSFTIWSSAAHAAVMAVQAMGGCSRTFPCFNCAGISKLRRIRRSKIEV